MVSVNLVIYTDLVGVIYREEPPFGNTAQFHLMLIILLMVVHTSTSISDTYKYRLVHTKAPLYQI